ncbi:hypothetical protein ACTXGU_11465 [Niallia sp. 01092]
MSITKQNYAKKLSELGEQLKKVAEEYAEIPKKFQLRTQEDVDKLKKAWLLKTDDFRIIQSEIHILEIPTGFEADGQKLRDTYQKYVDYIEEKTMKFGLEAMKSGEIDLIQKLEIEASQEIKRLTSKLAKDMFGQ